MTFHVGQRVVCVDDKPRQQPWPVTNPGMDGLEMGAIYIVRELLPHGWPESTRWNNGRPAVKLMEIYRPHDGWWGEPPYEASRFRPIVERKTDISIFRRMLTDAPNELERVQ